MKFRDNLLPINDKSQWRVHLKHRSSRPEVFYKKPVLKSLAKFTGKHLCQSLFFNNVADLRSATLLKKRLWHRCFPVNFAIFLRRPILQSTSGRVLLEATDNRCNVVSNSKWVQANQNLATIPKLLPKTLLLYKNLRTNIQTIA